MNKLEKLKYNKVKDLKRKKFLKIDVLLLLYFHLIRILMVGSLQN